LAPGQTKEGFYAGESVPVNQNLSDVFLQLHISERSGRGVPKITEIYGDNAFEFRENSIVVTLPFNTIDADVADKTVYKVVDNGFLNTTQERLLQELRNNPNLTQPQLASIMGLGKTAIQNNIAFLKKNGYIERVGANKRGYWKVIE
jgi:predicted HTH transcriptional regulator